MEIVNRFYTGTPRNDSYLFKSKILIIQLFPYICRITQRGYPIQMYKNII